MNLRELSEAETPRCGDAWLRCASGERRDLVQAVMDRLPGCSAVAEIVHLHEDGQVILRFKEPVPASRRGGMLLDLEAALKAQIDNGLTVWLEPLGDKNSLRKLRGIEVKSEVKS